MFKWLTHYIWQQIRYKQKRNLIRNNVTQSSLQFCDKNQSLGMDRTVSIYKKLLRLHSVDTPFAIKIWTRWIFVKVYMRELSQNFIFLLWKIHTTFYATAASKSSQFSNIMVLSLSCVIMILRLRLRLRFCDCICVCDSHWYRVVFICVLK